MEIKLTYLKFFNIWFIQYEVLIVLILTQNKLNKKAELCWLHTYSPLISSQVSCTLVFFKGYILNILYCVQCPIFGSIYPTPKPDQFTNSCWWKASLQHDETTIMFQSSGWWAMLYIHPSIHLFIIDTTYLLGEGKMDQFQLNSVERQGTLLAGHQRHTIRVHKVRKLIVHKVQLWSMSSYLVNSFSNLSYGSLQFL